MKKINLYSKFSEWIIGDYLKSTGDIFEQAKIRMVFNFCLLDFFCIIGLIVAILIASPFYEPLIASSIVISFIPVSFFILKRYKNVYTASAIFCIARMIALTGGVLLNENNIALSNLLFFAVTILFAYFNLGKKWGILLTIVSLIIWLIYLKFKMYSYMHNEAVYHQPAPTIAIFTGFIMLSYVVIQFVNVRSTAENKMKINNIELKLAKKEVEKSLEIQEQFLATTSHEVRSPLNGITGLTRQLMDTPISETQRNYLQAIKTSSDNLLHIINDILDVCKIRANKIEFEKITFDLRELIKTLQTSLQHRTEEKGIYLKYVISDNVPKALVGDPVRLYQILLNLVNNAVKFTEKGGVTISVSEIKTENASKLEFKISDTGIGIRKEKLEYIFENFMQAESDTNRKYGGTGLGLGICKSLIEQQGGKIHVGSVFGEGSIFTFYLTFKEGDPSQLDIDSRKKSEATDLENIHVLVVDDNPINRHVALQDLTKLKANVEVAHSAENALTRLGQKKYDLILMDVYMPGLTGIEATSLIRSNKEHLNYSTPIIAFSASVTNSEKTRCINAGMNDYISKPFDPEILRDKILKWTYETTTTSTVKSKTVTDLSYLSKTLGLNPDGITKVVNTYVKTVPPDLENLNKHFSDKHLQNMWSVCHKLKQSVNFVGATDIVNLLSELETEIKKETVNEKAIELLVKKVNELIELSVHELQN